MARTGTMITTGLMLVAGTGLAAMSRTQASAPVVLDCRAEPAGLEAQLDTLCAALETATAARTAAPVQRVPARNAALTLRLTLISASSTGLTARLGWNDTPGPELTFGVSDTTLDTRFYTRFARNMLQASAPPLP